ncbi:MAG TPA: sugar ABC transporter permease [Candidatus Excrementavichristensenella intestinipullorum]|nr:sugar ABC transporter permease [Candidatus Excrementavichristensenella intestinipullorum]
MKKNRTMVVVFLAPALIFFCAVFVYPILRTLVMSAFHVENVTSSLNQWRYVGFDNYQELMGTSLFRISMWNLVRIWAVGGVAVMALALLLAVILNSGIRFKKFFRAVIYMPNIISAVALATMWLQYVYNPRFGLLTTFFNSIGLTSLASVQWTDTVHKFWALLGAYCFGMVGYHMLIFSSGIEKIPAEYYEASTIDGAGQLGQFLHITCPLLKGVTKTNITMWSITSVGFFVWSQLFSTVTADTQTITPMVYLYTLVFGAGNTVTERNAGMGAAVGVVLCLCVVAVFLIVNWAIKDDDLEF